MNSKKKTRKGRGYQLCEAVADIAFIAGTRNYYGGNSREDIADFLQWAEEFESKWKGKEWGADDTDDDYIDEITKFVCAKIDTSKIINQPNK